MAYSEFEQDTSKLLLDAVNVLLQMIGEPPIDSEDDYEDVLEAKIALDVIKEAKREILSEEWDINTDDEYTLAVGADNKIPVPFNVLSISSSDGDLIVREWLLYSKSNQTQNFTEPQTVKIIWDVPFNNLTHALRNYVTISAARKFQARQIMDRLVYSYSEVDEGRARVLAKKEDRRTSKPNMYNSPYGQEYLIGGL